MQFCFGGETCYAQIVGQVVFSQKLRRDADGEHEIGIKFSAVHEWEKRILESVVQLLRDDSETRDHSFLAIRISEDILAREAKNLSLLLLPFITKNCGGNIRDAKIPHTASKLDFGPETPD